VLHRPPDSQTIASSVPLVSFSPIFAPMLSLAMDLLGTSHRVIPMKTQQLLLVFWSVFSGLCQGCGFVASSNVWHSHLRNF